MNDAQLARIAQDNLEMSSVVIEAMRNEIYESLEQDDTDPAKLAMMLRVLRQFEQRLKSHIDTLKLKS